MPVKRDKKPLLTTWAEYQTEKATTALIDKWWDTWPDANIAIITGQTSGIIVVDADSENGLLELDKIDSTIKPTVKTPKGWHYYFKCEDTFGNATRFVPDCDIRGQGGYVVAPPSRNGDGNEYKFLEPLDQLSFITDNLHSYIISFFKHGCGQGPESTSPRMSTSVHNLFQKGTRDDDIFHVANCCLKGGMMPDHLSQVINILAKNCDPPFSEKEAEIKIKSALSRENVRTGNLHQEVKELVLSTSGHIMSTYVHNCLQLSTRKEKKACSMALSRLVEEGILERSDKKAGEFRIVNESAEPIDWKNAKEEWAKLYLPWKLDEFVNIPEGGIILLMGNPGAGKTAACLYITRYNMKRKWDVHYLSSEISEGSFRKRAEAYKDLTLEDWNVKFYYDSPVVDTIKGGRGNLYIVDYLEIYDNFWQIGKMMSDIYKKLKGAVAIICIQKRPGSDVGIGGQFTQFKPALTLALEWQKVKLIKARDVKDSHIEKYGSPNAKEYHFKMINNRTQYIEEKWWTHPVKERNK